MTNKSEKCGYFHKDDFKYWEDLQKLVYENIGQWMKTKAQKKRFQIIGIEGNNILIKREVTNLEYPEKIPKEDFNAIWKDLRSGKYKHSGYGQGDYQKSQNGQNRHCAISFALVGKLPYLEWKKVGRARKLFFKDITDQFLK